MGTYRSLGLGQLLPPSHTTSVSSGNADSVQKRWCSCSPCQHHGNLQHPGRSPGPGLQCCGGTGSISENWWRQRASVPQHPLQMIHCVQVSTLKNKMSALRPTCLSCRLHGEEAPLQGVSPAAVRAMPGAMQTDTAGLPPLAHTPIRSSTARSHPGKQGNTRVTLSCALPRPPCCQHSAGLHAQVGDAQQAVG